MRTQTRVLEGALWLQVEDSGMTSSSGLGVGVAMGRLCRVREAIDISPSSRSLRWKTEEVVDWEAGGEFRFGHVESEK